jgi:hypothetical protein
MTLVLRWKRDVALMAALIATACGGKVSTSEDSLSESSASTAGMSTDPDNSVGSSANQGLGPADSCGTHVEDEGTASEPVELYFDHIFGKGWLGSVGTGASCYRISGVVNGNEFFLESPVAEGAEFSLALSLYEYSDAGFGSDPICVDAADDTTKARCQTSGNNDPEGIESDIRFLVVDGSATLGGGRYELVAEP